MAKVKIIECPRDAMQGMHDFVPTEDKINYINQLLKVGFDTIDFGSFVSPKAIPQMKDVREVLAGLELDSTESKLLSIVANERGASDACEFDEIEYLGYPFSISETFQMRNTNATIEQSMARVEKIKNLADNSNKKLVLYLSMAFGNPYGDPYSPEIALQWIERVYAELGVRIIALSDTIGSSTAQSIADVFGHIAPYKDVEFGAHLHTTPDTWREKVAAAYKYGCKRFDGAIAGYGGCPMATDKLTGNMPTEKMVEYFMENKVDTNIDIEAFNQAKLMFNQIIN